MNKCSDIKKDVFDECVRKIQQHANACVAPVGCRVVVNTATKAVLIENPIWDAPIILATTFSENFDPFLIRSRVRGGELFVVYTNENNSVSARKIAERLVAESNPDVDLSSFRINDQTR